MQARILLPLKNPVKHYAWGDTGRLQELFGLDNPDAQPQAEIWMGAHPGDPSLVLGDDGPERLDDVIDGAPERILGRQVVQRFGKQLPFLFKVLNAGQPLSIQLHPSKTLAEEGFAREEAAGIAIDAPQRNYVDANHKPELIYALTPFRALCGFRPLPDICADLERLDAALLNKPLQALREGGGPEALQAFCRWLLQLSAHDVAALLPDVLPAARAIDQPPFRELLSLHDYYPGDRGVLFAILLNLVELAPGEALFMSPGHLHSYLGGVGLEIMASSDNVIRGGLTPKHVDCGELMNLATFEHLPAAGLLVAPEQRGALTIYPAPVEDFTLALVDVTETAVACTIHSAEVLFCISGNIRVSSGAEQLQLHSGQSCLVSAQAGTYQLSGGGRLARAAVAIP